MITQFLLSLIPFFPDVAHATASAPATTCTQTLLAGCLDPNATALQYIDAALTQNTGYIITAVVIIIVASGVQYMMALGSTGEQGKAKQRIVSVIIGIIFFTLIRFALSLLANGLNG